MGYFYVSFFLGFGIGPLIGGFLSDYFGMKSAFYTMGGFNFIAFTLGFSLLPKREIHRQRNKVPISYITMIRESKLIKALFTFRFTVALARGIFSCFLPIFAGGSLNLSSSEIGILVSIGFLLNGIFQAPGGRLADRFSRRGLVMLGVIMDAICLSLIPLMNSLGGLLTICIVSSTTRALCLPSATAMIASEGKKYGMGSSMAIFNMAMSIGMATGPLIGGLVFDSIGLKFSFWFGALIELIGILPFAVLTTQQAKTKDPVNYKF